MQSKITTLWLVVFLAAFTPSVYATPVSAIAEALKVYPHAEVFAQSQQNVDDYVLALSAVEDVRGGWALEREERLEGDLKRQTLKLPEDASASEAYLFYQQALQKLGGKLLFRCDGRQCGRSNIWANNVFREKQLYGQDIDQQYGAFRIDGVDNVYHYLSVYTVRRGNRRVMVQLDWLQASADTPVLATANSSSVIQQLRDGYYRVPGVGFDDPINVDEEHLRAVVRALLARRSMDLQIIGHDYSAENADTKSQRYAEQFMQLLLDKRIGADRLSAEGRGASQPRYDDETEPRLELILRE